MDGGSFTLQLYNESGESQGVEVCEDMDAHLESSRYRASLSAAAWQYVPDSQLSGDTRFQFVARAADPRAAYIVGLMDSSSPFGRGMYPPQSQPRGTQSSIGGTAFHSPQPHAGRGGSSRTDAGAWGSNPQQSSQPSSHQLQCMPPLAQPVVSRGVVGGGETFVNGRSSPVDQGYRQQTPMGPGTIRSSFTHDKGQALRLDGGPHEGERVCTHRRRLPKEMDGATEKGSGNQGCMRWIGQTAILDLTTEERKKLNIPMTFERPLWDAMEWYRLKAAFTMDNTMASEELRGMGSATASEAGLEGGETETSGGAPKTRRTNSGKVRGSDVGQGVSAMTAAMEDTSRRLCDGLDTAAGTLASATTEGAALMVAWLGDMATEIGHVAGAMRQGNSVLDEHDGWFNRPLDAFGREITKKSYRFYDVDVNGRAAVDIDAPLGFRRRSLSHVLLWVKKTGDFVPDEHTSMPDIVGDIVERFVDNLASEHASSLDMGAFYYTFFDPPLLPRHYLHVEIRL
ncbi:hypothetical protein CBR_g21320 [Chara braunii]|uniref:Uncharacterized protein n=1 Tax=Chara braunii TaxID=69332 RepID=A0A388L194_CHABU|nr:hypothetical protein CBR_g21320 [Chara braunii]|eukprot:GBG76080.1 hypothetical protein CBR_g21320 [Chara braunii]